MEVIKRGIMPNGTDIQIEDWHSNYPETFAERSTLASYPIATWTLPGAFAPKAGMRYRIEFDFESAADADAAFAALSEGKAELKHYAKNISDPRYAPCIGA